MDSSRLWRLAAVCRLALTLLFLASISQQAAAADASLHGAVVDQLGGPVAEATVTLMRDGQRVAGTTSGARGEFTFEGLTEGRYQVDVSATGFQPQRSEAVFVGAGARATLQVGLRIGVLEQHVVVTAAAGEVPQSQVGAPVTVIDAALLDALGNTDLLEPLRTVPGVEVVQTGARGGTTSIFVRGGASNFNKVLIDGVPANDIGGAFDFSDLSTAGVERVEVLRGSNSVRYGSDALTGVLSIMTRRGATRVPEATLSIDGGNLGTSRAEASLGGGITRFDYFAAFSHLQTDNRVANNAYRNNTFASRAGAMLGTTTRASATLRHIDSTFGSPNATGYYGISDDSSQGKTATYASVAAESQLSSRWTSTVRFSVADQTFHYLNPSPTGLRSDPSAFANYLGNLTTISGGNGYSVTGRAILDYGGTYPSTFDSDVTRRLLYGETIVRVAPALEVAGGVRLENEHGTSGATSNSSRTNGGAFVEARAQARGHLYVNGGLGFDDNEIFGRAWTPRLSVAAYVRQPSANETLGDMKLTFNAGKGIKEPSLGQELSSLYALVPAATASSLGLQPIGPERSRSVDVGVEQGLAGGRGRLRLAYFDNEFVDLIEYVNKGVLPQLGVPSAAAAASGFGAYVNSQSNTAHGVELSGEARLGALRAIASYMHLDARVTKSFSSGALSPAINPAFPSLAIGQYSPLVGNRPFRRPANSGSLVLSYAAQKTQISLAGYFVGKQDDSTLLSDAFFGYSMLLPNQDMDRAYQKFDVHGSYQIHPRLRGYVVVENVFDARFAAVAGFPALPRTVRAGVTVRFGGS
jgi:iron complex outermembrane receptor protein/vitamin B12 transporter